jgi:peroxiredoxin
MNYLVKVGFSTIPSRIVVFLLTSVLLFLVASLAAGSEKKSAPDFTLNDLSGRLVSLSSYRGKTILINFWATWCVPCLKEIPDLVKLQRSIKGPFTVVGIAVASGEPDDITKFTKDHGMNYPILLDPDQRAYQKFRLIGLPASFLVDKNGTIAKSYVGPQTYEKLIGDIRTVLRP